MADAAQKKKQTSPKKTVHRQQPLAAAVHSNDAATVRNIAVHTRLVDSESNDQPTSPPHLDTCHDEAGYNRLEDPANEVTNSLLSFKKIPSHLPQANEVVNSMPFTIQVDQPTA